MFTSTKNDFFQTLLHNVHDHNFCQGLSTQFHLKTAYLGQLFKKETGKLLSVYLNELRVGKAVELLQNSSLKTKEFALMVGYPNPDYFYKIFKNITGIYPSEYLEGSN
ncbi:helix-turn-helix domain-containing protein [Paenibacillus sacheonensis]|uniref:helix-turn-helix domain-containing protein n=1 Tax=Paenibacillus sacheonensis TaxID=742054 RepID=UPI003084447F